ncbi:MAG: SGNH/GDSL hydrolase family protein [bacterium]
MRSLATFLLGGLLLVSAARAQWDGAAWADYDAFLGSWTPAVVANLRAVAQVGVTQGREPGRLGQIGDSITESSAYFRNVALNGPSSNETGHDYAPIRSWLAYHSEQPADANSFYREHGKGNVWGNKSGWRLPDAVNFGHPDAGVLTGDGSTPGNYSWVLIMFGTNDIDGGWNAATFETALRAFVQGYVALGVVPVLSTIPPEQAHVSDGRVEAANAIIQSVTAELEVVCVDFYGLILHYQPTSWFGTLISGDGTHPSSSGGGADFSQTALTETDGYAARSKLTLDVAERVAVEIFEDVLVGAGAVESDSWSRTKARYRGGHE